MAKKKETVVSVVAVFDGKLDGRQVLIDLILSKYRENGLKKNLDAAPPDSYNRDKVFSEVRVM